MAENRYATYGHTNVAAVNWQRPKVHWKGFWTVSVLTAMADCAIAIRFLCRHLSDPAESRPPPPPLRATIIFVITLDNGLLGVLSGMPDLQNGTKEKKRESGSTHRDVASFLESIFCYFLSLFISLFSKDCCCGCWRLVLLKYSLLNRHCLACPVLFPCNANDVVRTIGRCSSGHARHIWPCFVKHTMHSRTPHQQYKPPSKKKKMWIKPLGHVF